MKKWQVLQDSSKFLQDFTKFLQDSLQDYRNNARNCKRMQRLKKSVICWDRFAKRKKNENEKPGK